MTKSMTSHRTVLLLFIPAAMLATLVILLCYGPIPGNPSLSMAITADLLLTVPLVYFLFIRKTRIPNTTVVPVLAIGLVLGTMLLPPEGQMHLNLFKTYGMPLVELAVLMFVILKVRKAIKAYRSNQEANLDFFTAVKQTCREIFPAKVVMPVATEVALIYYGFLDWKKRPLALHEFSYHKNSGTPAILAASILLVIAETAIVHILLARWNEVVAWILTGLSIYSGFQLWGWLRSLGKRPISIGKNTLELRYGIMSETYIPFAAIENIEVSKKAMDKIPLRRTLSPLGDMEATNVILRLNAPETLHGIYGIKRKFQELTLHVDEPERFVAKVSKAIEESTI